jgi:hypothetical protein
MLPHCGGIKTQTVKRPVYDAKTSLVCLPEINYNTPKKIWILLGFLNQLF